MVNDLCFKAVHLPVTIYNRNREALEEPRLKQMAGGELIQEIYYARHVQRTFC
jgi:hypothetical protein